MLKIFTKLFASKKRREEPLDPDAVIAEKWEADFSNLDKTRFALIDTSSHRSFIEDKSFVLVLKRANCLAFIENPLYRYGNFVIRSELRIDALGGYSAAGISFRMIDEVTNYTLLVSSKGFFRVDVIRNRNPLALLGWTEIPCGSIDTEIVSIEIIASGNHFVFILNHEWAAEIYDDTLLEGMIGFASASYAAPQTINRENPEVSKAYFDSFSIESRALEVEDIYTQWENGPANSERRFPLAETYFAMNRFDDALTQLSFIWDQKNYAPSNKELLLAAKASLELMHLNDAEIYLHQIDETSDENLSWSANLEKARFLYLSKKYEDLQTFAEKLLKQRPDDVTLLVLCGHAHWNLKNFSAAAQAYEHAAKLDNENGIPAKNAGNAYDILGDEKKAVECYLQAGRCFLKNDNYDDLNSIIPRLLFLDAKNWEVHALAGKLAFALAHWQKAESEFDEAEKLRGLDKSNPKEYPADDPALVFLRGLLFIQKGRREDALIFLEKAIALDDEHSVFHFKLAETRFLLFNNPHDEEMKTHLAIALSQSPDDGWILHLAARIALASKDIETAENHLAKAAEILGGIPPVKVLRAQLLFQKGLHDEAATEAALETLEASRQEDSDGMMANCAGNLLAKLNRYEDAEAYYRKALSIDQDNLEYKLNLASCLVQLGLYIEAENLLTEVNDYSHDAAVKAAALEMIAFIAVQKAEYQRAEETLYAALKLEPHNFSVIISLGWIYINTFRWKETEDIIKKLENINIDTNNDDYKKRYKELKARFEEEAFKTIACSGCDRKWKVRKTEEDVPPIRLVSEPPDDLPAGTCPECKKTYCIGCAKNSLDEDGRFICKDCGKNLKLADSGLKKIINDWSSLTMPAQNEAAKKKRGRPKKDVIGK